MVLFLGFFVLPLSFSVVAADTTYTLPAAGGSRQQAAGRRAGAAAAANQEVFAEISRGVRFLILIFKLRQNKHTFLSLKFAV